MRTEEFKNRYIIKLSSSILLAVINIIIQIILPRALSVQEYGYYSYNLNVFTSVVSMANLSTSNAMVSKFSKRNEEIGIVWFYLKVYALISVILSGSILLLYPTSFVRDTFIGQTCIIVLYGLFSALLTKLLGDCVSMYDALAIPRFPAIMQIVLKLMVSVMLIVVFLLGHLDLFLFYCIQCSITLGILIIMLVAIIREQRHRYPVLVTKTNREYFKEYVVYCKPLVLAIVIAQSIVIIMNWALMRWAGATEQAMFGVAWQLNSLVGYVFTSYAELSKREFAVLHNDFEQLKKRFIQSLRITLWITSYFAIFIAFFSEWIIKIFYGNKYSSAEIVTILIMLYTIYQAWGQICGAYMLALEQTKMNAVIAIIGQVLTLLFVFLLQIPNIIWPNGLGAIGIALNYFLVNIIMTNINVGLIVKSLCMSIKKILSIQIIPILMCSIVAFGVRVLFDNLPLGRTWISYVIIVLCSGVLYTICIGALIIRKPWVIGISEGNIRKVIK